MTEDPFLLPDHCDYAEIMTDAAVHVLAVRGVADFSVAALARWMKVAPESIHNVYSRARVIDLVAGRFARRWLRWSLGDPAWARSEPVCPLQLPRTPEERHGVQVLGALAELARGERLRGNPLPLQRLADLHRDEAELLGSRLVQLAPTDSGAAPDPSRVDGLMAVVSGLRQTMAAEPARLTWEQAAAILAAAVSDAVTPTPAGPTTRPDLPPPHEPAA